MIHPSNFGYNPTQKRFVVEASSLLNGARNGLFEPIYENGGTDEGLCMHLADGRGVARFLVSSIEATGRTIRSWTLIPTRETVERLPHLDGHTVFMLNC